MSISPYQYQLLTQSFTTLKPNFHCFCVSLHTQLKNYNLELALPSSSKYLLNIEHNIQLFLSEGIALLPQQSALVDLIKRHKPHFDALKLSEQDIAVLCHTMLETLQLHLGRQFTLALRNAWRKALHMFANIIKSVVFQTSNVVNLQSFRQQKQQQFSTIR
ncbi:hypothetical protein PCIT_a0947 [Pseudoalteromonas citrea]|uniref:Globin n=2 Tax=Pseudoalteromonas citrea TaxID=43655 RepID=A0AAD4FTC8_9GAMM|nr:globin [Pseudoalteromonas citrea]KAF7774491.1 hypothetical protein PCIT_a0947 [Pseudoalteromonas citrea]